MPRKKRHLTTDEALKYISEPKITKMVNKQLSNHLSEIVNDVIVNFARVEAMKLLRLASREEIGEFLYYFHSDSFNICALVLDSIKDRLYEEDKLPKNIGKNFGFKYKNDYEKKK